MKLFFILFLFIVALVQREAGANDKAVTSPKTSPYRIEERQGESTPAIVLERNAIERLHITSIKLPRSRNQPEELRVPSSSVIYDSQGATWVYAQEGKGSFYRVKVILKRVESNAALVTFLGEKIVPSMIVDSGVSSLYGTETGVGK